MSRVTLLVMSMLAMSACMFTHRPFSPADEAAVFAHIKTVPLNDISDGHRSYSFSVVVPNSQAWRRVSKVWGKPSYVFGVLLADRHTFACFKDNEIQVQMKNGSNVVPMEPVKFPVYGYSTECSFPEIGKTFQVLPGQQISVAVNIQGLKRLGADLVVLADWGPDVKDKLVGLNLYDQIR